MNGLVWFLAGWLSATLAFTAYLARFHPAKISECEAFRRSLAAADLPVQGERYWCPVFGETSEPHGDADCKAAHTPVDATDAPSAVGGAPGVSETHTDPKEAPDELR